MRINFDYLRGGKELVYLLRLSLRGLFRGAVSAESDPQHILIINTCLIGEFVASMPAIRDCIQKHAGSRVDVLVAPSQKSLAEKLIGVGVVHTARPAHARRIDHVVQDANQFAAYEQTVALRVSPEAYKSLRGVSLGSITTSVPVFLREGPRLWFSALRRRVPTQYRDMNFAFLGYPSQIIPWQEVVHFTEADQAKINSFAFLKTSNKNKKVLIHTNVNWPMKQWEAEKWVALLEKIHAHSKALEIVFIGAADDEANHQEIASQLGFTTHSLVGKLTLAELLLVMTQSDYFLGLDSGPSNLSHVADLRSLTILGCGPHMFLPSNPKDRVVDKSRGRGLYQMFFATKKSFISQISVDEVYTMFLELLQETQ